MNDQNENETPEVPVFNSSEEAEKEIEAEIMVQNPRFESEPKKQNKIVAFFKKIYHFLWVEESAWSYIAFILLSFIILRFVAFPVFLGVTGYSDVAAVITGSMKHEGVHFHHNFDQWLEFNKS